MTDFAHKFHVTPRYSNTLLRETYGLSFSAKLLQTRLENAKLLLTYSDRKVSEICTLCGFETSSYFYSVFRREAGVTPSEYRRQHPGRAGVFFDPETIIRLIG